jgi:hypothetical protein
VEPWTFYFLNGFLNFNIAFYLALLAWPLQLLVRWLVPGQKSSDDDGLYIAKPLHLLSLYLWFGVFFTRPHKEERFLFPVYPLVALAAACSVDALQKLFFRLFVSRQNKHYLHHANWLSVSTILVFTTLALSRIFSMCINYNAPLNVWMHVSHLPSFHEVRATFSCKQQQTASSAEPMLSVRISRRGALQCVHRQGMASFPFLVLPARQQLAPQVRAFRISRSVAAAVPPRRREAHRRAQEQLQ